jgi:hypothetical protein
VAINSASSINTLALASTEVAPSIKVNENVLKNPKVIAESFDTYFLTIIKKMNSDITALMTEDTTKYLNEGIPKTFPNINLIPTTANEFKHIINSLKSTNSFCYDEISTELFKSCTNYISFPLSYLCNQ